VRPSSQYSEAQLEALLKSGSQKDFEILYSRFSDALYGVLCRILRQEELAEDALQEAFVKIWRNCQRYDASKGTIFTWMLNIARNHAIDKLRSTEKVNAAQSGQGLAHVHMPTSEDDAPDELLHRSELLAVVDRLPEPLLILIDLVYVKGYTQAEVAENLNIPLGTVKTRIRTALQLLRRDLEVASKSPSHE